MDRLMEMVQREGILLLYRQLDPDSGLLGLYIRDECGAAIVLDVSLPSNPRLERCVLAEELGHHYTAPITSVFAAYASATFRTSHSRDEARALRWACDQLMPVDKFLRALREGVTDVADLADLFFVTEWMVHQRFRFLHIDRSIGGRRLCRRRGCPICGKVA